MLTARDEDVDKIIGLEVGADDYLTKPFNPRELVAREVDLRRATPERRQVESAQLKHGELKIDAGRREVHVGEQEIQLAPKEFDLLWELLDHKGLVLTRDQLLERVWGYTFAGDTRTVDVHVRQLRRKLGDASRSSRSGSGVQGVADQGRRVERRRDLADKARRSAALQVLAADESRNTAARVSVTPLSTTALLPRRHRARGADRDRGRAPALPGLRP